MAGLATMAKLDLCGYMVTLAFVQISLGRKNVGKVVIEFRIYVF